MAKFAITIILTSIGFQSVCRAQSVDTTLASLGGVWCTKSYIDSLSEDRSPSLRDVRFQYVKIFPDSESALWALGAPGQFLEKSCKVGISDSIVTFTWLHGVTWDFEYHPDRRELSRSPDWSDDVHLIKISETPDCDIQSILRQIVICGDYVDSSAGPDTVVFSDRGVVRGIEGFQKFHLVLEYRPFTDQGNLPDLPREYVYDAIILEDTLTTKYIWLGFKRTIEGIRLFKPFADSVQYLPKTTIPKVMISVVEDNFAESEYHDTALTPTKNHPNPAIQRVYYIDGVSEGDPMVCYGILFDRNQRPVFDQSTLFRDLRLIK